MPIGIALIDWIVSGIGVAVGTDEVGEPPRGIALQSALLVDGIEPIGGDIAGEGGIVPAGVEVDEAGTGVAALADACPRPDRGKPRATGEHAVAVTGICSP
jgi:hypothetical protein